MARRVLVLHGPTLTLEAALGRKLSDLDEELVRRGKALDLEVETFQANGEAALVDVLLAKREGLHGVIVNPASLAPIAFALADTLEVLGVRCIEVQLHHESKARGRSALRRIVDRQLHGQGVEGYFKALSALAKDAATGGKQAEASGAKPVDVRGDSSARDAGGARKPVDDDAATRDAASAAATGDADEEANDDETSDADEPSASPARGKTIGRKKPKSDLAPASPNGKTIGRKPPGASPSSPRPPASAPAASITRALVREQITARLGKKLPPEELARWARSQWLAVQHGASTEPGQHELLEAVLLMLSTSAKASDHVILSYAAKLGA